MEHRRSVQRMALYMAVIVAAAATGAWGAAWAATMIGGSISAGMATLLQVVAAVTAVAIAALYLLMGPAARTRLVAAPVVLTLVVIGPALGRPLLPRVIEQPLLALTRQVTVFLIFPAGAMAVGLLAAIALDLIAGSVRLWRAAGR